MKIDAAGVIVLDGPRILAFSKTGSDSLSLPCGKVEPGETPAQAAVREAKEETWFDVQLSSEEPFVGVDLFGGAMVAMYRANVIRRAGTEKDPLLLANPRARVMLEPHAQRVEPIEGFPVWASIRDVAVGHYWHYNTRALRHFGIRIPLTGKFHSHITVNANSNEEAIRAARLTGGKPTFIDLSLSGRTQRDVMITHHYVTGERGLEDQSDVEAKLRAMGRQIEESGVRVTRLKLEYDLLHNRNERGQVAVAMDALYTEVHIKCVVAQESLAELVETATKNNWRPSSNPYAKRDDGSVVQFVNRRFYGAQSLQTVDDETDRISRVVSEVATLDEIKYESAVMDTADNHDKWWAGS